MVKIEKIQKILESSENFQNFGGGFIKIGKQTSEQQFLENRAKPPKIMIFAQIDLSIFALSVSEDLQKGGEGKIQVFLKFFSKNFFSRNFKFR